MYNVVYCLPNTNGQHSKQKNKPVMLITYRAQKLRIAPSVPKGHNTDGL